MGSSMADAMAAAPCGPAYRIETDRLVIRCYEPGDAAQFNAGLCASWDHVGEWLPFARGDQKPSVADSLAGLRRWRGQFDLDRDYVYGIFASDGRTFLGSTGLHTRRGAGVREIGYWVHVDHIGKGYATESTAALVKVAFEVDQVRQVKIFCDVANVRSAAVPRKLGFTHEATLREHVDNGEQGRTDAMLWTMLAREYPGSVPSRAAVRAYDVLGELLL